VLHVEGLEKSFGEDAVLRGADLEVSAGETVALLGANGSGKTTLLRAIVGLTIPDRGRILVDGIDAARLPREARRRLSFLPQRVVFPGTLTVAETLRAVARLRGLPPARLDEEIAECHLSALAGRQVAELSGGQRQRVGLAVALLPDVGLYLFDEPSANLDTEATSILLRRIRRLHDEGRSVLFTTHVASDVQALATRTVALREGRTLQDVLRLSSKRDEHEDLAHRSADARTGRGGRLRPAVAVGRAGAGGSR
jgi:ABC-type multidrug transport system ATPase subunit